MKKILALLLCMSLFTGCSTTNDSVDDTASNNPVTDNTTPVSYTHLQLKGKYLDHEDEHRWVILIHGYKSSHENMTSYGAEYYQRGYNVVLPDNRAHGKSEGDYIGMGWLDKDDIALSLIHICFSQCHSGDSFYGTIRIYGSYS